MKTFLISDTHFMHSNIIKYCNRPFKNVEEMNQEIIKRWNSVVSKNDIVYHLGDFAFGNKSFIESTVNQLNGKIHLILGNHDGTNIKKYMECGFDKVYDKPILYEDFFILSHQPIEWLDKNGVFANIYGHVHNDPRYQWVTSRSMNVSADVLNFTPIEFEKAIKMMQAMEELELNEFETIS